MELQNLLKAQLIDRTLINSYLERLRRIYVNYHIFVPIDEPDFVIFRKKVGQSTFGQKPNVFTVDITADEKIHYTQLSKLS